MKTHILTGRMLRSAIIGAANALNDNKTLIDSMNVFPVPDGDTGTNMYLTALSAAVEVEKLPETADVGTIAKAASAGALRGARGNSGVILSQLFRGFAKGLEGKAEADGPALADGFARAVETAYKAIMKPKEGTILTVARETADKAQALALDNEAKKRGLGPFFKIIIDYGNAFLPKTKEMLPALKAADVEDAGGKGFLVILEGAYAVLNGGRHVTLSHLHQTPRRETADFSKLKAASDSEITFGYCTEFFIHTEKDGEQYEDELLKYLDSIGDSVVTVSDGNLIKIHVHTNHPGEVMEKALSYGALDNIKIENMRFQHTEMAGWQTVEATVPAQTFDQTPAPFDLAYYRMEQSAKGVGFIAVASGAGFCEIFRSLGADYVIEGGQTMNPSAEEFLTAIYAVAANEIIIFPNNKNIIMAAEQAGVMCKEKSVYVVKTRSMPQGLAALMGYVHSENAEANVAIMEETIMHTHCGQLTHAVRNTVIDDINITKGDAIGIIDGDVTLTHKNFGEAAKRLVDKLLIEETSYIAIYYGEGVKPREAEKLMEYVKKRRPDCECEIQNGGQPIYKFILSAE